MGSRGVAAFVALVALACGDESSPGAQSSHQAGGAGGESSEDAGASGLPDTNRGGTAGSRAGRGGSAGTGLGGEPSAGEAGASGAGAPGASGAGEAGAAGEAAGSGGTGGSTAGRGGAGAFGLGGAGGKSVLESIDELLTRCPTEAELKSVDDDFVLVFDNLTPFGDLVCTAAQGSRDLNKQQERAYQAFIAMRAIQFDQPLPWTNLPLYDWFANTIDGVIFEDTNNYCCTTGPAGTGMFTHNILGSNGSVFVTDLWANSQGVGMVNMVDVMVHEARHVEVGAHTCGSGDDSTYTEKGVWATVYDLHAWLAYHADPCFLRPTLPADARYPKQVFDANAYQLSSIDTANYTSEYRLCDMHAPLIDPVANPPPTCP